MDDFSIYGPLLNLLSAVNWYPNRTERSILGNEDEKDVIEEEGETDEATGIFQIAD